MKTSQLPYLVKLLDDESPGVREEVLKAMSRFGATLDGELEHLGISLSRNEEEPIRHLLEKGRRKAFKARWRDWRSLPEDKQRLEAALQSIVALQDGNMAARALPALLDGLAEKYCTDETTPNAIGLSEFLFKVEGLRGVGDADYMNPLNSNLVYVIKEKKGLPITLACVFLLVGHRLGLSIEGCNFPGHFLVIASTGGRRVLVDCYNSGRMIDESALANVDARVSMRDILRLECRADVIVARVLRNLVNAYHQADDAPHPRLMIETLSAMDTNVPSHIHRGS
jgi:regulator of sirC expression with transglutaminase-like and TPR domain